MILGLDARVRALHQAGMIALALASDAVAGVVGTAHPLILVGAARDASWTIVCQAREDTDGDGRIAVSTDGHHGYLYGDAMVPWLVYGDGPGERIGDVLAGSEDDRWLVVAGTEPDVIELVDTRSHARTALRSAAAEETNSVLPSRAASFDPAGDRLLYLVHRDERDFVRVRDLATGTETELDPGPGYLVDARFDRGGAWIVLDVVPPDLFGRAQRPEPESTYPPRVTCWGPVAAASFLGWQGGHPTGRIVPVAAGGPEGPGSTSVIDATGLLRMFGNDRLVQREDGSVWIEPLSGQATRLTPEGCDAVVLATSAPQRRLVAMCRPFGDGSHVVGDVEVFGEDGLRLPTGLQTSGDTPTRWPDDHDPALRMTVSVPYSEHSCCYWRDVVVDVRDGRVWDAPKRRWRVETEDTETPGGPFVLVDGQTGERRPLPSSPARQVSPTDPWVVADGHVFDLDTGAELGTIEGKPLAASDGPRFLVGPDVPSGEVAYGPLEWVTPERP